MSRLPRKWQGQPLKVGGLPTKTAAEDCCCGDICCEGEIPSRFIEGLNPTTTAECGTVFRAEIIDATNGCADIGDYVDLYEDAPNIWATRPSEFLDKVGSLSGGCGVPAGFTLEVFGCPSSDSIQEAPFAQCNPPTVEFYFTVLASDLACACPFVGGYFIIRVYRLRKYGDLCP